MHQLQAEQTQGAEPFLDKAGKRDPYKQRRSNIYDSTSEVARQCTH